MVGCAVLNFLWQLLRLYFALRIPLGVFWGLRGLSQLRTDVLFDASADNESRALVELRSTLVDDFEFGSYQVCLNDSKIDVK